MPDYKVSRRSVLAAALLAPVSAAGTAPEAKRLTVFAAASLTDALDRISAVWQSRGQVGPRFSFASSAALARQIDAGAPADLFLSADEQWMDWLAKRDRLSAGTRRDLVGNRLVLVQRKAALRPVTLAPGVDLAGMLGAGSRLAVGDPASVPAGIYAKQALTALGLWSGLRDRLAPAENVRAALLLVQRGEAPAGIVYASDVHAAPDLAVAGVFPESSHAPIVYPGAVLKGSAMPRQAERLLAFLAGGEAQAIFRNLEFGPPAS
jgi:molybdate transport system substrate-binding protein